MLVKFCSTPFITDCILVLRTTFLVQLDTLQASTQVRRPLFTTTHIEMGSISQDRSAATALSLVEAGSLLAGRDFWHTTEIKSHGIGSLRFSDGPNGVRGEDWVNGPPSLAIPCATALGASFDANLVFRLSQILAKECGRKGVQALLAPTINIHRYSLCEYSANGNEAHSANNGRWKKFRIVQRRPISYWKYRDCFCYRATIKRRSCMSKALPCK